MDITDFLGETRLKNNFKKGASTNKWLGNEIGSQEYIFGKLRQFSNHIISIYPIQYKSSGIIYSILCFTSLENHRLSVICRCSIVHVVCWRSSFSSTIIEHH